MVGQSHVVRALINALDNDKLHHAYLFTGTRGVGKTTIARILAKSLNCEQNGVSSQPCGVCSSCQELDAGHFVDLIEVDAASKAKVDETRELMENVQFLPIRGRYKVYLIDEVHMFSGHSFNALLKTLEEPPSHVKFLLATTDPRKLPITVLSRCLQFNLKRLPIQEIAGQLEHILQEEGISADQEVIRLIATAADGSMRDALSLLDQAISYCVDTLGNADIKTMLGTVDQEHIVEILKALATNDANRLMARAATMAEQVPDFDDALSELLSALQRIAMIQLVPDVIPTDLEPDGENMTALAKEISPEDVQLYYQIGLMGRRDLPFAPDPAKGFEMTLLRMLAFRPTVPPDPTAIGNQAAPISPSTRQAAPSTGQIAPRDTNTPALSPNQPKPTTNAPRPVTPENWPTIVSALSLVGVTKQFAENSALIEYKEGAMRLHIALAYRQLAGPKRQEELETALRSYLGNHQIRLIIEIATSDVETPADIRKRRQDERQQATARAIDEDPNVQALCKMLDGKVEKVVINTD